MAKCGMEQGLRQGDPLSPFLFILFAEGLNCMMEEAVSQEIFRPTKVDGDRVTLSHLQFADDAVFCGEWSEENARSLLSILHCFKMTSGLKINLDRSILSGVEVGPEEISSGWIVGMFSSSSSLHVSGSSCRMEHESHKKLRCGGREI